MLLNARARNEMKIAMVILENVPAYKNAGRTAGTTCLLKHVRVQLALHNHCKL